MLKEVANGLEHQVVPSVDDFQGGVEGGVALVPKVPGQSFILGSFALEGGLEGI